MQLGYQLTINTDVFVYAGRCICIAVVCSAGADQTCKRDDCLTAFQHGSLGGGRTGESPAYFSACLFIPILQAKDIIEPILLIIFIR